MAGMLRLKPAVGWVYDLILHVFASMVNCFFRDIQIRGAWHIPAKGSVILVAAPHANQFVDSVILMKTLRSLNRRPFVGTMASIMGAVPISRAMDVTELGQGTIMLVDPINKPEAISRLGTNFDDPMFKVGVSIYLPTLNGDSQKLNIAEIRNAEMIILKNAPTHADALLQLTGKTNMGDKALPGFSGSRFKIAPHRLRTGGCLGIFPEGGSHDRTELLPLKVQSKSSGIAIMALGVLAQGTPLTIVPVGMNYFSAHKFRSRAVIEFGDAVNISPRMIHYFQTGKKRETIGSVMREISEALGAVTVSAPDFETLNLIHAARRLYLTKTPFDEKTQRLSLAHTTELNRRLSKGYHLLSDTRDDIPEERSTGLHRLPTDTRFEGPLACFDRRPQHKPSNSLPPVILFFLTLPGLLLFGPIFILTSNISRRKTEEALAASSVKVRGNDVMATWKILIAAALSPVFYIFYTILLVCMNNCNRTNGVIPARMPTPLLVVLSLVVLPSITYAALLFREQDMDILKSLYPLSLSLNPRSCHTIAALVEERNNLVMRVGEMVDRFGTEIFPDFHASFAAVDLAFIDDVRLESLKGNGLSSNKFNNPISQVIIRAASRDYRLNLAVDSNNIQSVHCRWKLLIGERTSRTHQR
ncbi:glycerol-3-phosphate O-acyltransferase [Rhexocercosporidium sp. MPI-PUGE-AT-0058]|nr:glycerol-3-phosphate O-acyltransferase [Rhexocercosporidium sp. MPI-PUGE-AT-0058]